MDDSEGNTYLARIKAQAEVLIPLVKAFEARMGASEAREVARDALGALFRRQYSEIRKDSSINPIELVAAGLPTFAENALEYDVVTKTTDRFEFDVSRCAYAEFFREIGEEELGFLLVCDLDNAMAEGLGSDLGFERTQTIMQGAPHCDFRYRRKK